MRCPCGHEFGPSAATYKGAQLYPSNPAQGDVYLYLLLFNCPRVKDDGKPCASTRCLVMFDDTFGEDEQLEALAAE